MIKVIFTFSSFCFLLVLNLFSDNTKEMTNDPFPLTAETIVLPTEIKEIVDQKTSYYGIPQYVYYAYLLQSKALNPCVISGDPECQQNIHQVQNVPFAEFSDALLLAIQHHRSDPESMREWAILASFVMDNKVAPEDLLDIMLRLDSKL